MISEALSAGSNIAKEKAGYRSTNRRTWSGRGRGLSKFVEYFDQEDLQRRENMSAGKAEKVLSKDEEGSKGHLTKGCSEDKPEEMIGHKKTTTPKEEQTKNKNDLKDFLFKYIVEDKEKDLCLDFIGQILGQEIILM